jgi:putative oxidoreductase
MSVLSRYREEILSVVRIMSGLLLIQHGLQKVFGFPIAPRSSYELMTLNPGLSSLLELIGGPLLVLGLFTKPVALVLSGFLAVAYFMAHAPQGFWPIANNGEGAVLYCFIFLYIAAAGGGAWSLDRVFRPARSG